jgi:hypothetical protein
MKRMGKDKEQAAKCTEAIAVPGGNKEDNQSNVSKAKLIHSGEIITRNSNSAIKGTIVKLTRAGPTSPGSSSLDNCSCKAQGCQERKAASIPHT